MSDNKIIFSMIGVGKVAKPNRQILKDIYLFSSLIGVFFCNYSARKAAAMNPTDA
jgi:hypothetical protein